MGIKGEHQKIFRSIALGSSDAFFILAWRVMPNESSDFEIDKKQKIRYNKGVKIMNSNILQDKNLRGGSYKWANWMSQLSLVTCEVCWKNHGKIENISILKNNNQIPVNEHMYCKCIYVPMRTKRAGYVTNMGYNGADIYLLYMNRLPDYYVTKEEAAKAGWIPKKQNLSEILPGKQIGGNIYLNHELKLPEKQGRIWYEADFDFTGKYRNSKRILYSNDGLIFISYDHAQTFYELVK